VKRQSKSAQFRINEDLSLSATDAEDMDGNGNEEDIENDLALVGAVPGAVDQIPFSYMDYLEDARLNILSSRELTDCWLFDYDGINPSVNFFNDMKLLQPVSGHVAEKTQEIFTNFLGSDSSELVTLDQLGINIPTEDNGVPAPVFDEDLTPVDLPVVPEKTTGTMKHSRSEVDDFYRTLMGDIDHEPNTIDDDADLSKAEEMFNADITAVEDSINEIEGDSNSTNEAAEEPEQVEMEEDEIEEDEKHENSILELCDVEEQLNELGDEFLDHQSSSTIPVPIKVSGAPYLGPFLGTIFGRLEQMPTNSLYLNLMLTGIVTQLGSMSLPLLRGLLLDTRIIFQPGVPSLYQVCSMNNRIIFYTRIFFSFSKNSCVFENF